MHFVMSGTDFDLFVIGGGSGGVRAARIAAGYGAKVAIAERDRFGGTCVIRGCVPKKLFVYASRFSDDFEDARGFGWTVGERSFDWATLVANKDREITRIEGVYEGNLKLKGVTTIKARAKLDEAGSTGKTKAQTKARSRLDELEESLALLQSRQSETLTYLADLKRDAEQSLKLAQGIRKVADDADKALRAQQQATAIKPAATSRPAARKPASKAASTAAKSAAASAKAPTTKAATAPAAKTPAKAPTKAPAKTAAKTPAGGAAAKPAASRPAPAKAPARARSATVSKPAAAAQSADSAAPAAADSAAKPATAQPAAKAVAKKPATRKPAAKRTATQTPASSS